MTNDARNRHDTRNATAVALVLSVLLHVPLIFLVGALRPDGEVLDRTNFDAESAFSIDLVADSPDEPKPKPKQETPEETLQYVTLDPPEREETPEKANFADKYESRTDQEMVKKALPGAAQPVVRVPRPVQQVDPDDATGESESDPQEEQVPPRELTEDGVSAREESASPAPSLRPTPSDLFPTLLDADAAEMLGEAGSNDYLRDVAEGDKTLLNRKRTRYWAFFDRVKRQVSKQWSPGPEYRKRDPYGNVYGVKDRYSTVDVTLNGDGTVRRLYLSRGSGLDFFDDEAIRALQSAAPFHNPPEGLKDEDGLVHFTFGFYFEISTGTFRFMRLGN